MKAIWFSVANCLKQMSFGLKVMVRPFSGYWDLKKEKKGSVASAVGLIVLYLLMVLAWYQFAGFFAVTNKQRDSVDIFLEACKITIPYLLWVVSSWCFTSLMDGEGTFRDIAIATAYALTPMIVFYIPQILLSRVVSLDEISFVYLLRGVGMMWSAYLLFASVIVTHQYTIGKAIGTIVLTIVGMLIIIFLSMMIVSLLQQAVSFFVMVYREAKLRWS